MFDETELQKLAEEAMTADTRPKPKFRVFGQVVTCDLWAAVLESGKKVPFDSARHPARRRSVAITIEIQAIRGGKLTRVDYLDWESKWTAVTVKSLRDAGLHLSNLLYKYVSAEFAPTGRTYKQIIDGDNGPVEQTKQETALKFLESYGNQDQCEAAMLQYYGEDESEHSPESTNDNPPGDLSPSAPNALPPNVSLQAAKLMWSASKQDATAFRKMLKNNPNVAKSFGGEDAALAAVQGDE